METYTFIGSSIFLYIMAFIAVMIVGGYLTYRTSSPKHKKRREEKRNKNNLN